MIGRIKESWKMTSRKYPFISKLSKLKTPPEIEECCEKKSLTVMKLDHSMSVRVVLKSSISADWILKVSELNSPSSMYKFLCLNYYCNGGRNFNWYFFLDNFDCYNKNENRRLIFVLGILKMNMFCLYFISSWIMIVF